MAAVERMLRAAACVGATCAASVLGAACGGRPIAPIPAAAEDRIAIIASERGPQGARLVAIDEHGDRRFPLLRSSRGRFRDTHPTVSPDGAWVVFASSRDRALDETSLWIAPLGVETQPVRLTEGAAIDSHPTWTRDGRAIVFASTRDGGDFDLWRLAIAAGQPAGAPSVLTAEPGHEVTPTVDADGTLIFAAVTPLGERAAESHLAQRAPDGTITPLTRGPADASPALSPDGTQIAFTRPVLHDGGATTELWRMTRAGERAQPLVVLPITDETGPVWSRDGRFVFATSVLRGEAGVLFSSVIHIDVSEPTPRARILRDTAGAIPRLTPAIAASTLDAAALHDDPEYLPELARIMAKAIENQRTK